MNDSKQCSRSVKFQMKKSPSEIPPPGDVQEGEIVFLEPAETNQLANEYMRLDRRFKEAVSSGRMTSEEVRIGHWANVCINETLAEVEDRNLKREIDKLMPRIAQKGAEFFGVSPEEVEGAWRKISKP